MRFEVVRIYESIIRWNPAEVSILRLLASSEAFHDWALRLYEVDKMIGGFGAHNVDINPEGLRITGAYLEEDRDIFRSIQYCSRTILESLTQLDSRYLVDMSGAHVEDVLKRYLSHLRPNSRPGSLGVTLTTLMKSKFSLEAPARQLLDQANTLNQAYVLAKHEFARHALPAGDPHSLDADTHTFSFDDAMVAYFAARILGLAMMTPMFKKWGEPKSLTSIPVLGY